MPSLLRNMQETVIKYSEVLSQVLRVDVEIVDKHLFRVAGTGMYSAHINKSMANEGYVYAKAIETGKKYVIMEPGKHEICRQCHKENNCDETFEIGMPIKINTDVIGVIGLVCFTQQQKDHILGNLSIYIEFLEQISDLISSKAKEEVEKKKILDLLEILKNIVDKVEQGVFTIDENNNILNINNMAMKILKLDKAPDKLGYIRPTGNTILDFTEYELDINDEKHIVLGERYRVARGPFKSDRVYIFTDLTTLEAISTSITTTTENMGLSSILGESQEISLLKEKVIKLSASSSTVLITGESGTGKELFARAIHMESDRRDNAFIAINCAAIPDALLESELFGYVKGAFTGADPKGKIGKIELANEGTIFLDEIGDMPLYLQSKLLRVLEQKEITRLGSNAVTPVDIRVIAATNKDLEMLIKEKMFREDLYYRLNVIPFQIPPLRERKGDIKCIVYYFIEKYSRLFSKHNIRLDDEVWDHLYKYSWPGNVRELENAIEYIMNMMESGGLICQESLPGFIFERENNDEESLCLEDMEKRYIIRALELHGTDQIGKGKAAKDLGIGIATLYRKIKKYGIE